MSDDSRPGANRASASKRGSAEDSAGPRFIAIGRVIKPHGVQGEVRVEMLTDVPERFKWLQHVYVGERSPRRVAVESVRYHQTYVLLKLVGFPTRTEAELLRNELLLVPEDEAVPLEEGEYFLYQLQGVDVVTEEGEPLGALTEVLETGANNVFVIRGPLGEILVPDIPDVILNIDLDARRVVIRPLPGMLGEAG